MPTHAMVTITLDKTYSASVDDVELVITNELSTNPKSPNPNWALLQERIPDVDISWNILLERAIMLCSVATIDEILGG